MPHISFSELKLWNECPWKHKLVYLEGIKAFKGNEHTAFGTALHTVCENMVLTQGPDAVVTVDPKVMFQEEFLRNLQELPEDYELRKDLIVDMRMQGCMLTGHILPSLKEYFGNYELVSVEEKLYEDIEGHDNYSFKGYIDLVLKTPDGKYHIIDWKTCSWGWDTRRKSERMTTYQLTLYKHFFCIKHNIDPADATTHFALLKRTAKKNNIEIFKVTSGNKKTENALKLLNKSLYNLTNKNYIKNRMACQGKFGPCEFLKSQHCN